MNMIFNRSKVQIELEKIIKCPKKEELKQFKEDFLEIQITHSNRATLIDLIIYFLVDILGQLLNYIIHHFI